MVLRANAKPAGYVSATVARLVRWGWLLLLLHWSLLALLQPKTVWAQSGPDPAEQSRRQAERENQLRQQLTPRTDVQTQPELVSSGGKLLPNESPCFVIQGITLSLLSVQGAQPEQVRKIFEPMVSQALERVNGISTEADPPLGLCLGSQGIATLINRAQNALLAKGYVTARVLAAPQNLQTGQLELTLIPGVIKNIVVQTDYARPPAQWNTLTFAAGELLNLRPIEQTLENLKRPPSAQADFKIEPGDTLGTSLVRIAYDQGRELRFTAALDDSGLKSTGIYQGSITMALDNMLTLSDVFYVTLSNGLGNNLGNTHPGDRGTQGNTVYYSMPIGYWSVSASANSSNYYQSLAGNDNKTTIYSGNSTSTEVALSRLMHRDAQSKAELRLKAFMRKSNNYIDDNELQNQRRLVSGWELGAGRRQTQGPIRWEFNVSHKRGTGDFGDLPAAEEVTGTGTARFSLLAYDGSYSLPLPVGGGALRYGLSARLQNNLTPLTPQDRFAIGGRYSVRGFDGQTILAAERGWWARNELSYAVLAAHQLYAGLDYGEVRGPTSDYLAGHTLTGAVLGWRGAGELAKSKYNLDFFVGTPVDKPKALPTASLTTGFNVSLTW